jgi:hypothetical protein
MIFFEQGKKIKKITWLVIFDDGKEGEERKSLAILCHQEIKKGGALSVHFLAIREN